MTEYYAMPSFVTLEVEEVAEAARWYGEALGFESIFEMLGSGDELALVHLRRERYQDMLLVPASPRTSAEPGRPGKGATINFSVDENIDELARLAATAGARIVSGPADRPWNVREVTVEDPEGYRLAFSRALDTSKEFSETIEQVRQDSED